MTMGASEPRYPGMPAIVDGSEAVRFLVRVKELIEDPGVLLIES